MQKLIASFMAVGVLLLAACSTAEVEPGPINSLGDIAGTYQSQPPGPSLFVHFFADGTFNHSSNRDLVVDRPEVVFETRFEGTQVFITTTSSICNQPDLGGTYEILALENGNLQFVAIDEDTCAYRSSVFQVAELAPVP